MQSTASNLHPLELNPSYLTRVNDAVTYAHEQEKRFKELMNRYQREKATVIHDEVEAKIQKPQSIFTAKDKRSQSVVRPASRDEDDFKLPQLTRKMMRQMDEKFMNKKIFQPLHYMDANNHTGVQKYFNDYFEESTFTKKNSSAKKVKIPAGLEDDPVFQKLGGGKADLIDKMSYLSKKELAKNNALVNKHNFAEYEAMALKNENEISINDIAEGEEEQRPFAD